MRVAITGKGSYIGVHIKSHFERFKYQVDEVDTISDEWKSTDYSQYDVVVHVAAIVHENSKKADEKLFKIVNTELPVSIAKLAKQSGVKAFIFFSSMAVYGVDKSLPKGSIIDENTPLNPTSLYGKSKLEAEKQLSSLSDESFRISFVRPPNVYGQGCKGNYMSLFEKIAMLLPLCPFVYNEVKQSMIYIDNLSELIRLIIKNNGNGVYTPQDDIAPSAVELIYRVRRVHKKKTHLSKPLGSLVRLIKKNNNVIKLFGGVQYDYQISKYFNNQYQIISFKQGIELSFCEKNM